MPETNARIKVCHDTAANFKTNNPTLLVGEWALETDTKKMKIGDGTTPYNSLQYSTAEESEEWQKPADWIDIRRGAINNSIYVLSAHSAPTESEGVYTVADYPKTAVFAEVSNSDNTYDVFVDGIKVATTASGTATPLDWGSLYTAGTVSTVYQTTHPSSLVYHIIRLTPTTSTDTLTSFSLSTISGQVPHGTLWVHFELSNPIKISRMAGHESNKTNAILEAITAKDDKLTYAVAAISSDSGLYSSFAKCTSLLKLPVLVAENQTYVSGAYLSFRGVPAKKVVIKNNKGTEDFAILNGTYVHEFDIENGLLLSSTTYATTTGSNAYNLKKLPSLNLGQAENIVMGRWDSLEPCVIDDSSNTSRKLLRIYGSSSNHTLGLKGLTVSNAAPFDGASPQINVSYTGLSRAALVNLFKSMPYNVGYNVVGTPTIVDGVVSGFSTSNYVQSKLAFNMWDKDWELVICTPSYSTSGRIGGFGSGNGTISFNQASSYVTVSWINHTSDLSVSLSGTFTTGNQYFFKLRRGGEKLYLSYSTDGVSYGEEASTTPTAWPTAASAFRLGSQAYMNNAGYGGSIDVAKSYLKADGVTWFNGANAVSQRVISSDITVVGSPTISNGVVSGFSNTSGNYKYLQLSNFAFANAFEISCKFLYNTSSGAIICGVNDEKGGVYLSGSSIRVQLASENRISISNTFIDNTWYSFKYTYDGTTNYSLSLYDNSGTLINTVSGTESTALPERTYIRFGAVGSSSLGGTFNGSIDLNNTYIKVDGSVWMSGTQPMTKTCSVVGCTGTADLTAGDKAIATGKGWALTVA